MTAEAVDIATVPCFVGIEETHVTFISQSRLTSSDVLAITITTMKRMLPQTLLPRSMSNGQMKLSLPAAPVTLSIPRKRMNKILHAERDAFMKKLYAERSTRTMLECWAAIRIQALFRGYRVRPHAKTIYDNRRANLPAVIRKEACVKRFLARVAFIHLTSRHIDELVLWSVIVVQVDSGVMTIEPRPSLRPPLNINTTHLHQDVAATKLQAFTRGSQTRQRRRSGRVMGPPKLPRASSKTNLLGEMRKNVYSVEDTAVAAAMLEDVHAAEFRHRAQRYMQSMASLLPKAEVLVQGTVGQGRPKTLTSTRPNKTAPILPRTEETEFHMYAPVEKLVKRCPSTAAKVKLPDEVDAALEAATKIQALVRGSMARSNTKDSKKLSRGVVVGRH
ncbi:hypothetical protein B5M09_006824 [Aphanomyces astaci]|uniref:Uncharacterized protein n=1 Tax=Aphanomyces astaci TaxID=112090 RepID=A0A425D4X0_APHAT|nr:hypothetical protein B5M09_006824 [Aphanomyces astaci]